MKKFILLLFTFTFAIILSAQPSSALKVDTSLDFSSDKIVFFGDSLTAGVSLAEENRWSYLVGLELGFDEYVNMGVAGSRVTQDASRTDSLEERVSTIPTDADYIFVMAGWNDWNNDVLIADFEVALQSTIDNIRTNVPSAQIILMNYFDQGDVTTNTEGKTISDFYDVVVSVSDDRIVDGESEITGKVQMLDLYSIANLTADEVALYTYDGLHPNKQGSRLMANMIISYLGGKNLDESTIYSIGRIASTGTLVSDEDYRYTEQITVVEGKSYAIYCNNSFTLDDYYYFFSPGVFYDADGNYLADLTVDYNVVNVVTAPTNAAYMVVNYKAAQVDEFYVHEIINEFTIDFVTNGATPIDTVLIKDAILAEPVEPTRDDYVFAGWYTDDNFDTEYDFNDTINENITLHAKWTSDQTITTPGTLTSPSTTLELWGIAWYWYAIAAVAAYWLFGTKEGKKFRKKLFK